MKTKKKEITKKKKQEKKQKLQAAAKPNGTTTYSDRDQGDDVPSSQVATLLAVTTSVANVSGRNDGRNGDGCGGST